FVKRAANEYDKPKIVLYITASITIENTNVKIGEICPANTSVGIAESLILGYSDCNAKLINPSKTRYTTPPTRPPRPDTLRLDASPPIATNVLKPTAKAKPP